LISVLFTTSESIEDCMIILNNKEIKILLRLLDDYDRHLSLEQKELYDKLTLIETDTLEREKNLRKLLWLKHGCSFSALYGDDGEMQCGICMIDFKRMSLEQIEEKLKT